MKKLINVYTYYDDNKTVIGRIRPKNNTISKRTYDRLLKNRTVGGCAGIYTTDKNITVLDNEGWMHTII